MSMPTSKMITHGLKCHSMQPQVNLTCRLVKNCKICSVPSADPEHSPDESLRLQPLPGIQIETLDMVKSWHACNIFEGSSPAMLQWTMQVQNRSEVQRKASKQASTGQAAHQHPLHDIIDG